MPHITRRHAVHGRRLGVMNTYRHAYCYSDAISWNVLRVLTGSTRNFYIYKLHCIFSHNCMAWLPQFHKINLSFYNADVSTT